MLFDRSHPTTPVANFCIGYLADQVTTIVVALVFTLISLATIFAAVIVFRQKILVRI